MKEEEDITAVSGSEHAAGAARAASAKQDDDGDGFNDSDEQATTRMRRTSEALATRGSGSVSCMPKGSGGDSSAAAGTIDGRGVVVRGTGEEARCFRGRVNTKGGGRGRGGGGEEMVSFAGSNTEMGSESAWTAGTVTSRG